MERVKIYKENIDEKFTINCDTYELYRTFSTEPGKEPMTVIDYTSLYPLNLFKIEKKDRIKDWGSEHFQTETI